MDEIQPIPVPSVGKIARATKEANKRKKAAKARRKSTIAKSN